MFDFSFSSKIVIERNLEHTFEKFCSKLKSDMKIEDSVLSNEHVVKTTTSNYTGKVINLEQHLSVKKDEKVINIKSIGNKSITNTTFSFKEKNGECCELTFKEHPEGNHTILVTLNYMLFSLPLLRRGTIKKINHKLNNIKNYVERNAV